MRRFLLVFLFIVMAAITAHAEKITVFPSLLEPHFIAVSNNDIIIADSLKINIYSRQDFKLKKSFGTKGPGPKEFLPLPGRRWLKVTVLPEKIVVTSMRKVSFFKRDGSFINEINDKSVGYFFRAMSKNMVGYKNIAEGKTAFQTLYLFDSQLNPLKELSRVEHKVQKDGSVMLLKQAQSFDVGPDRAYLAMNKNLDIHVFDQEGNEVTVIKKPYDSPRKVTAQDKKDLHAFMKLKYPDDYSRFSHLFRIPDHFPPLVSRIGLTYDDNKGNPRLFLLTWEKKENKSEVFLCDPVQKTFKQVYVPIAWMNILQPYPFTVSNGVFYQLMENEENEEWELHKTPIY